MSQQILIAACLAFGLSAALVAGVFQSFSDFIMRGLASVQGSGGMASMQAINVTVINSWFLRFFIALAPLSVVFALYAVWGMEGRALVAVVLAAAIYVPFSFVVTLFGNVPMNNALADLPSGTAQASEYWTHYYRRWTQFNTLRTWASAVAAACYFYAAVVLAGQGAA